MHQLQNLDLVDVEIAKCNIYFAAPFSVKNYKQRCPQPCSEHFRLLVFLKAGFIVNVYIFIFHGGLKMEMTM